MCGQIKSTKPTYNDSDVIGGENASPVSAFPSVPLCIDLFEKINNLSRCEAQIIGLLCNTELGHTRSFPSCTCDHKQNKGHLVLPTEALYSTDSETGWLTLTKLISHNILLKNFDIRGSLF